MMMAGAILLSSAVPMCGQKKDSAQTKHRVPRNCYWRVDALFYYLPLLGN